MIRRFPNPWALLWRHPRRALLVLLLGVLATGTAAVYFWAQHHLHAAQRALERYDLDEAQHHLDLCLKVRSGSAAIYLLAAQTARRRDAYHEAEQHLAACVKLEGMKQAVVLERMLLTAQQGNLNGVQGSLRARTGTDRPEAVLVLEALAKGYVNCYWQTHALICLNILLDREPRHPQALLMRARVLEDRALKGEQDCYEDALRDYEKAAELAPTFEARLGLAGALYRVGRPWDALSLYEQIRLEQPGNADVQLGLARCRYTVHDVDEARRLLDELLEQYPDLSDTSLSPSREESRVRGAALLERGRLALHAGQLADAEMLLRQAASLAPRCDFEAVRALGQCLEAANKIEDARRCLEELGKRATEILDVGRITLQANREPRNLALRYEAALRQMRLGRELDGVAALFFVLDQEPRHWQAHEALADYFEHTGQPDRAAHHRRASLARPGTKAPAQ